MNWKELKERIEKMPEADQLTEVLIWSEEFPPRECYFNRANSDVLSHDDWTETEFRDNLSEDECEGAEVLIEQGTYFLWAE